jgi:hypothetical protein
MVFYLSENQQDVSIFKEEFLVDENKVRDNKVCIRVWHLSKSQADHLRPAGNLQPLSIPEWKW